jgi:hypothetical protein
VYTAVLSCQTVLAYDARSWLPVSGEKVPCRRHGFCIVDRVGGGPGGSRGAGLPRARPRTLHELLEWLDGRSATTLYALRCQRFTLRLLAVAQREGVITVDLESGAVTVLRCAELSSAT